MFNVKGASLSNWREFNKETNEYCGDVTDGDGAKYHVWFKIKDGIKGVLSLMSLEFYLAFKLDDNNKLLIDDEDAVSTWDTFDIVQFALKGF